MDGVTPTAVLVAAVANLAFGVVFGWRSLWIPVVVFGVWSLLVSTAENGEVILDAGIYSVLFAIVGAAIRQLAFLLATPRGHG